MGGQIWAVGSLSGNACLEYGEIAAYRQGHARHHSSPHHAHAVTTTHAAAMHHLLCHLGQYTPERQTAQRNFTALSMTGKIRPDIESFTRSNHDVGALLRDLEQAAIHSDHRDR